MSHNVGHPAAAGAAAAFEIGKLIVARSQAKNEAERVRLASEVERMGMVLLHDLEARKLDGQREDRAAAAEFKLQQLASVRDLNQRMMEMYALSHAELLDERRRFADELIRTKDIPLRNEYKKRINGIDGEIARIQKRANQFSVDANETVIRLGGTDHFPPILLTAR